MGQPRMVQLRLTLDEEARLAMEQAANDDFEQELHEQLAVALERMQRRLGSVEAHKELRDRLGLKSAGEIYDWLSRRNGRRAPAVFVAIFLREDDEFAAWWATRTGFLPPVRLVKLTPEQERDLAYEALAKYGERGQEDVRRIRGGGHQRADEPRKAGSL